MVRDEGIECVSQKGRRRTLIYAIAGFLALLASGPMLPLELAVWFSGELLLYLEIVFGVWLTAWAGGASAALHRVREQLARARRYVAFEWMRSHPGLASWLQWTFAYQ